MCHVLLEAKERASVGFNTAMMHCTDQWEESMQLKRSCL